MPWDTLFTCSAARRKRSKTMNQPSPEDQETTPTDVQDPSSDPAPSSPNDESTEPPSDPPPDGYYSDNPPQAKKVDKTPRLAGSQIPQPKFPMIFVYLALILGGVFLLESVVMDSMGSNNLRYDMLMQFVQDGKVSKVSVGPQNITGELKELTEIPGTREGTTVSTKKFVTNRVHEDPELVKLLTKHKVEIHGVPDNSAFTQIFLWGILIACMLAGWFFILKRLNPQRSAAAFGRSKAHIVAEDEIDVRFSDVAGIDEAKEELQELILFLKDAERFERLGARIPKGVLLVGPPGTGKTLLAKAVAGEADVPFFSLSGSDFVEMFAGVGASRVRDLFSQAQKSAPCIVFIDELDAIGKIRGVGNSGAHDEREQTLNQLLSEMDGFEDNAGIIMLAATNRPEILDPALLRPGRFDRQVSVDRPDLRGRKAILEVHAKNVKMNEEVQLDQIAKTTPGFVGADLANLINEAALIAARSDQDSVKSKDFDAAFERIVAGLEKRQRIMRPQEKRRIAIHETGHALVALARESTDPVHRISIISRGVAALGYTMQMPTEDRYLLTAQELEERLEVMLGGRVAEKVILGDLSTGAADDLSRAVQLARRMVKEFGMSEQIGPTAFASSGGSRYLGGATDSGRKEYSEETAREIDQEIRRIINEAESRVHGLLSKSRDAVLQIAERLMEMETMDQDELLEVAVAEQAEVHPTKLKASKAT
jgi:cell division protease FtsH